LVPFARLSHAFRNGVRETITVGPARGAKILRDLQQDFVPGDDAESLPSVDKRAAYTVGHIGLSAGAHRSPRLLSKVLSKA
jgi:hypothetical protein